MANFDFSDLVNTVASLFEAAGLPADDARLCGDWLVDTEAAGVSSHGIGRVGMYLDALRRGKIASKPSIAVAQSRPGVLLVDGGNGLGAVVGAVAIDRAMETAVNTGIAIAVVRNSNHYGAAGYLLRRAVDAGFVAFTCSNGSPAMAVHGGADPIVGTNPLAAAFPAKNPEDSMGFDMATSVAAFGKIRLAQRDRQPISADWALAPDGTSTTDPDVAMKGALLPVGGSKGSALALMVEMLAGVLSGAAIAPSVGNPNDLTPEPANVGHAFVVLDVGAFMPRELYEQRVGALGHVIRASRPAAGFEAVRLPGTGASARRERALAGGVPLSAAVEEMLGIELQKLGLSLPSPVPHAII